MSLSLSHFLIFFFTVAVVFAFFLCWAPFHAQRLVAFYFNDHPFIYAIMTYISGVLYYLSTCINPLLYNLMSNKFREAFKVCEFDKHFLIFHLNDMFIMSLVFFSFWSSQFAKSVVQNCVYEKLLFCK